MGSASSFGGVQALQAAMGSARLVSQASGKLQAQGGVPDELCLSIHTPNRTLDVGFATEDELELWLSTLQRLSTGGAGSSV